MSKHYIYEIFGIKIGATNNVERRMKEQKVKEGEYRVIEEHTNAKTCSIREIELQKEFNYPVDRIQYWKTLRNQKKALTPRAQKKRIANTDFKALSIKRAANTDYKAIVAKIDYSNNRPPQSAYTPEAIARRVANTDYKASRAKVDWKKVFDKFDWEAWSAKIDWVAKANKRKTPVNQYDLEGNLIKKWDGVKDAAKELNISSSNIYLCCNGKQKTHKNYKWKYAG